MDSSHDWRQVSQGIFQKNQKKNYDIPEPPTKSLEGDREFTIVGKIKPELPHTTVCVYTHTSLFFVFQKSTPLPRLNCVIIVFSSNLFSVKGMVKGVLCF